MNPMQSNGVRNGEHDAAWVINSSESLVRCSPELSFSTTIFGNLLLLLHVAAINGYTELLSPREGSPCNTWGAICMAYKHGRMYHFASLRSIQEVSTSRERWCRCSQGISKSSTNSTAICPMSVLWTIAYATDWLDSLCGFIGDLSVALY